MTDKELIKKHNKGEMALLYHNNYSEDRYLIPLTQCGDAYLSPLKKEVLFIRPSPEEETCDLELIENDVLEELESLEESLSSVYTSSMYEIYRTQDYNEFLLQMSASNLLKASEDVLSYIEEKENDFKALSEELPIDVKYIKETLNEAIKKAKGK